MSICTQTRNWSYFYRVAPHDFTGEKYDNFSRTEINQIKATLIGDHLHQEVTDPKLCERLYYL